MKKLSILGVVCLFLILCLSFAVHAADMGGELDKACSTCHSTKRICLNLGVKSEAAWNVTVKNMVAKGARLSSEQIAPAAQYLTNLKPGASTLCK